MNRATRRIVSDLTRQSKRRAALPSSLFTVTPPRTRAIPPPNYGALFENDEPCIGCDQRGHCAVTGRWCSAFAQWTSHGRFAVDAERVPEIGGPPPLPRGVNTAPRKRRRKKAANG